MWNNIRTPSNRFGLSTTAGIKWLKTANESPALSPYPLGHHGGKIRLYKDRQKDLITLRKVSDRIKFGLSIVENGRTTIINSHIRGDNLEYNMELDEIQVTHKAWGDESKLGPVIVDSDSDEDKGGSESKLDPVIVDSNSDEIKGLNTTNKGDDRMLLRNAGIHACRASDPLVVSTSNVMTLPPRRVDVITEHEGALGNSSPLQMYSPPNRVANDEAIMNDGNNSNSIKKNGVGNLGGKIGGPFGTPTSDVMTSPPRRVDIISKHEGALDGLSDQLSMSPGHSVLNLDPIASSEALDYNWHRGSSSNETFPSLSRTFPKLKKDLVLKVFPGLKDHLTIRKFGATHFPPKAVEEHFMQYHHLFEVKKSRAVKKGESVLGIFMKESATILRKSTIPFSCYSGIISHGGGEYHLKLKDNMGDLIIDGTPNPEQPLTCFGRMNEDLYNDDPNVRILKDGTLIAIKDIYPGDELLTTYDDEYDWDWIKEEALQELISEIGSLFPWTNITGISTIVQLNGIQRCPLNSMIKKIILASLKPCEMHSATVDLMWRGTEGLTLYLTSGVIYEKYRFRGFGSGKIFPETTVERGELHKYTDIWNGVKTAKITPATIFDFKRQLNTSKRSLKERLDGVFNINKNVTLAQIRSKEMPEINWTSGRITVQLSLGTGPLGRQQRKHLEECGTAAELTNLLNRSPVWRILLEPNRVEFNNTPGKGYCGFIAMDRIINGMERSIQPNNSSGIDEIIKVVNIIEIHSTSPVRTNWKYINKQYLSPRERLISTCEYLTNNNKNWLIQKILPFEYWLNAGVLNGNTTLWDFSRWAITPVISTSKLHMVEGDGIAASNVTREVWNKVLKGKMLCHENDHFYTRWDDLGEDFEIAYKECLKLITKWLFPNHSDSDSLLDLAVEEEMANYCDYTGHSTTSNGNSLNGYVAQPSVDRSIFTSNESTSSEMSLETKEDIANQAASHNNLNGLHTSVPISSINEHTPGDRDTNAEIFKTVSHNNLVEHMSGHSSSPGVCTAIDQDTHTGIGRISRKVNLITNLSIGEYNTNQSVPYNSWDGFLTAELILRPNNEHTLIDMDTHMGRERMIESLGKMEFMSAHVLHKNSLALENYVDGPLPMADKIRPEEMALCCKKSDSTLRVLSNGAMKIIQDGLSGNVVTYDEDVERYTLNTAQAPSLIEEKSELKIITWNSNSWDFHKSHHIAGLVKDEDANIIIITDARIEAYRSTTAINSFRNVLQKTTGKVWEGHVSVMPNKKRVGGDIIMYSNLVTRIKINQELPFGVLTCIDCRWGRKDISILSLYRPTVSKELGSLRAISEESIGKDLEEEIWKIIKNKMDGTTTFLCGDFNLTPLALDKKLVEEDTKAKRLAFHGDHQSFRRWDSVNQVMQKSSIDHVVWNGKLIPHCKLADAGIFLLDHTPIVISSRIYDRPKDTNITKMTPIVTLKNGDKGASRRYVQQIDKVAAMMSKNDLSLQDLTKISVDIVKKIHDKRHTATAPSHWSPIAHVLTLRLAALGSTCRIGVRSRASVLKTIIIRSIRDEKKICLNEDEVNWLDDNGLSSEPMEWNEWKARYEDESTTTKELLRIKNLLSTENKKEFRRIHGMRLAKLQKEADAGRIGKILQEIKGRNPSFLMESLRDGDDIITDGHTISKLVNAFFKEWFARKPLEKERDLLLSRYVLECNKGGWDKLFNDMNVPVDVSERLWIAFQTKTISSEARTEAAGLSEYCPTYDEYIGYVMDLDSGSSPGFSGLSYHMVKLWPEEFQARAYQCLCESWAKKEGPEGWSIRLLTPIPKKPNPTIKDLRPLMLVEVMRKIWVGLLMNRIRRFWEKYSLIDERQHGYLSSKGTETAIPQVINAMETARELRTDLYMSSWDMSQAFDNLSREMVLLSLRRLHIPEDIARYIGSLDIGGKVYVKTPWVLQELKKNNQNLTEEDYFMTEKGVGQGDIPSPLLWAAAFDIPLTALALTRSNFKVIGLDNCAVEVIDTAYADDLMSMVATPEALQAKAETISAWCLASGVQMNVNKLRTFGVAWGTDKLHNDKLLIYKEGWNEVIIDINKDGFMTQLGVLWDMDLSNVNQFEALRDKIEELGARILRHGGRTGDKILALEYCLKTNVAYRMQYCVWGMKEYDELDKLYMKIVKKITKNMNIYPSRPIWALVADGGLGIQSLMDYVQKNKLRILLRNINRVDHTGISFEGLVARALRNAGTGGLRGKQQFIDTSLREPIWMTSLVDWLARIGLRIVVQGEKITSPHSKVLTGNTKRRQELMARGIVLAGEESMDDSTIPIAVRAGQCWELDGKLLEIVSFNGEDAEVLEWTSKTGITEGSDICVSATKDRYEHMRGHGTETKVPLIELSRSKQLIERSPDKITVDFNICEVNGGLTITSGEFLHSIVKMVRNRYPIIFDGDPIQEKLDEELRAIKFHSAYTDGSWVKKQTIGSLLLGNGEVKSGGAIVLHTNDGLVTVKIEMDIELGSAYEAEVVSLLIAHELSNSNPSNIYTDSNAALKRLSGRGLGPLSQVISNWKKSKDVKFVKVKAHPEKRLPVDKWKIEERGNYLADQVAGGLVEPLYNIKASEWLKKLSKQSKILVESNDGTPVISDISLIKSRKDIVAYLIERDEYRVGDGRERVWEGANIALHHKLMGRNNKIGDRIITQRLGLVKRWRWHSKNNNNICLGCQSIMEGIGHPLRDCRCKDMVQIRDQLWKDVEYAISKVPRRLHENMNSMARRMREEVGGDVACCGTFRHDFVDSLPFRECSISDTEGKAVLKILRIIGHGTRKLLRLSSEIQKGPLGTNYRQTAINEYYKDIPDLTKRKKRKLNEVDVEISLENNGKKARKENKRISIKDVFDTHNNRFWVPKPD